MNEQTEAGAVADIATQLAKAEILSVCGQEGRPATQVVAIPLNDGGKGVISVKKFLDEYLTAPERRKGSATLNNLDSFIAHANRFKDGGSALFAYNSSTHPRLVSVLDYHFQEGSPEGGARFCEHRGLYDFPLSDEYKAWIGVDGKPRSQADFAEFLDERIVDVLDPPEFLTSGAGEGSDLSSSDETLRSLVTKIGGSICGFSKLRELSQGLKIYDKQKVKEIRNISTGEVQVQFESEHKDENGQPLSVPNMFLIAIPVFKNGAAYRLPVRLRYRRTDGGINWILKLHNPQGAFDHAFNEACAAAQAGTDLPLFFGDSE